VVRPFFLHFVEFSIKKSVNAKAWDAGRVKGSGEEARTINHYLKHFSAHYIKPNVGAGARMTIDRREQLNLRPDFGYGRNTSNMYFTLAEPF